MEPLRIGVLGAARISSNAIVEPARQTGTRLVAVAARNRDRAEVFAAEAGVERVLDSYQAVLDDPEVEAIYNPLPNGLHGPWNARAIAAGKHVLSEKPFASNAAEAAEVRAQAAATPLVVAEAFHYRYHPLMQRMIDILASGEIGELRHVEAVMTGNSPEDDPRWDLELAGGSLMDLGCYSLHAIRTLGGFAGGPPKLTSVTGGERAGHPGVDEWVTAEVAYPSGISAVSRCNMASEVNEFRLRIIGTEGEADAENFVLPHLDDRINVRTETDGSPEQRVERLGTKTSYTYQLESFTAAIRSGTPMLTDLDDAVANMELIDACYQWLGMPLRPRSVLDD
jgi:predicted dehydrogenase